MSSLALRLELERRNSVSRIRIEDIPVRSEAITVVSFTIFEN